MRFNDMIRNSVHENELNSSCSIQSDDDVDWERWIHFRAQLLALCESHNFKPSQETLVSLERDVLSK
jgi:hypothetical protein